MEQPPRMIADAMLGKLARWLRLLGFDVEYAPLDDAALAARARAEGRLLLTRDHGLAARRGLAVLLITSEHLDEQLRQVLDTVGYPDEHTRPRCMQCNVPLDSLTPVEAAPYVPPYVARTQTRFRRCPRCGRITWPATHWAGIRRRLEQAAPRLTNFLSSL